MEPARKGVAVLLFATAACCWLSAEIVKSEPAAKLAEESRQPPQQVRLACQPGELRHFNYESSTQVWGSANQRVQLRASLRLRCMESPANGTLKYMAEVLSLEPVFLAAVENSSTGAGSGGSDQASKPTSSSSSSWKPGDARVFAAPVAEPVFEEVGEAISVTASRMSRSLSGWLAQTWSSVRDFFANIFASSERSSVNRDQAYSESGLDIASQCKSKKRPQGGLPIDDSVFDDLEPKYYIGASSDPLLGTAYVFGNDDDDDGLADDDDDEDANLSFFDDPKPKSRMLARTKRAAARGAKSNGGGGAGAGSSQTDVDYGKQLRLPFVFVQSRVGKIIEVRFSPDERDLFVKNFKRHVCDLFATNLDANKTQLSELSPIGQHTTKYLLDSSSDSSAIKQSLMALDSTNGGGGGQNYEQPGRQLVRVLALNAISSRPLIETTDDHDHDDDHGEPAPIGSSVQGREPAGRQDDATAVSVLRSINSTSSIQLNSRTISPDIERIQVQVEQVQRINEGRMTQSAGQLGVSLIQQQQPADLSRPSRDARRLRRSTTTGGGDSSATDERQPLGDVADLLQVSTSFSVQLVPLSRLGNFTRPTGPVAAAAASPPDRRQKRATVGMASSRNDTASEQQQQQRKLRPATSGGRPSRMTQPTTMDAKRLKAAPRDKALVIGPPSGEELEKSMQELRQLESKLQLVASDLLPESATTAAAAASASDSNARQRLELIRDQIRMRLNEEFMRNRLRERTLDAIRTVRQQQQLQASPSTSSSASSPVSKATKAANKQQPPNSLGLGLTQLVLGSGITSKQKGSVYSTIEEALELESSLDEDSLDGSVSKLLRETVRLDKLRAHCKSAIASLDEIRAQSSRLQLRAPFGGGDDDDDDGDSAAQQSPPLAGQQFARLVEKVAAKNRRRLEQCKQVVQLLLRVGDRKAADLTLELIDECNAKLLAASRDEELGHGPASKYYRSLRQQFIELMASINKPTESLVDRLMSRLAIATSSSSSGGGGELNSRKQAGSLARSEPTQQEFTYVSPTRTNNGAASAADAAGNYNKSLLREEDNANNNDVIGSLLMLITSLASKPTIRQQKRVSLAERLLSSLKGSACSPFDGPDLDILESMGNFNEPLDEMVGKIVHLAKRCAKTGGDQYVVACIHGLRGQMQHAVSQKFLVELLRSSNVSCTVKSEIVLTLIDIILIEDLKSIYQAGWSAAPTAAGSSANEINGKPDPRWPAVGLNRVDDALLDIIDANHSNNNNNKAPSSQDRKCLSALVKQYLSRKHSLNNDVERNQPARDPLSTAATIASNNSNNNNNDNRENRRRRRERRAVINEDKFWDEAQCKRWLLPSYEMQPDLLGGNSSLQNMPTDLLDEIDDNSIAMAIANSKKTFRSARRNQRLLEKEASDKSGPDGGGVDSFLRKRHKCTASKKYGPKNAEAILRAEIVNDLVGAKDENKFLARFRLGANFLGNRIDVGRMYLWHQKQTTRAHVNILGKSLWDTSQSCTERAPHHLLYMPLFDFNLWLVKISVGLKLQSEMGFFSQCQQQQERANSNELDASKQSVGAGDQLELFPTVSLRASGEASAKFVVARAGMSLASQYGYQGNIRVSRQPNSCMSIESAHQPMNVTFSSWFQLWDSDCHYWGSRNRAEPQATRWRLAARRPTVWLDDECLLEPKSLPPSNGSSSSESSSSLVSRRSLRSTISP